MATPAIYIARYDDLFTGKDEKIDVSRVAASMNGIELQDREFFAAIREGREPNASVKQVLPFYRVLNELERGWGSARRDWVKPPPSWRGAQRRSNPSQRARSWIASLRSQ
jgi:hypothetical protein